MGGCRDYAGSSGDGVSYGDVTFMDGATAASWFGWQNNDAIGNGNGALLTKGTFASGSFYTYFDVVSSTTRQIIFVRDGTNVKSLYNSNDTTSTLYGTGTWNFVTVTWTTGPTWVLYVNGESKALSVFTAGNPSSIANSAAALEAGSFDGIDAAMDGKMAYNGMYDTVISNSQVFELMWNPFAVFSNAQFMAPGWNPSATNEIDLVRGTSGTPTNASESFDGPPVGMLYAGACQ